MGKLFESLRGSKLVRSGILYSIALFVVGLGNFAFQAIIGRWDKAEYALVNSTLALIGLLTLPPLAFSNAISHYVAHFRAGGHDARLQGLLSGCRRALFHLTLFGSIAAVLLVKPLSAFFGFTRSSLMLVTMVCVLASFWSALASALCAGLSWFQRLAFILLVGMVLRLAFGWGAGFFSPTAEMGVLATGVSYLAYLAVLRWRTALGPKSEPLSPWNREFIGYVVVSAAFVCGGYCFSSGDILVAQQHFKDPVVRADYLAAGTLGRALPMVVAPMLTVLFTSRSAHRTRSALQEQLRLLALYALGLAAGAAGLFVLKEIGVKIIFGKYTPASSAMIEPLALTMVFVGLLQALGTWALASRWFKISIAYGLLGLAYWLVLLIWGKTPNLILRIMPIAAATTFVLLFGSWLVSMRSHRAAMAQQA